MLFTNHPFRSTGCRHKLPPSLPIPPLLQTVAGRSRPFDYAERCWERYGNRFTLYLIDMPPLVLLSSPEDIRTIVTASPDSLHSGGGGALMEPLFGESAFILHENDEHSLGRAAIMPAFHRKTVRSHAARIADVVDREIASWPSDTVFALSSYVYRLTLKAMLMITITSQEPVREEPVYEMLCQRMLDMLSVMASPLLQEPRLRHLPGWRKTWRRFVQTRHEVDELIYTLIAKRRDERIFDARRPCEHDRQDDLLDLLIAAHTPDGSPMSDTQVRDNLISVIIAGHETTAATLAWAFQLLAHNRVVQDRLIEEIDEGSSDTYMNAVIQETLRHKPTFLFLPPRVVLKPTEIGGWDYHPPAQMLACTYLLHHDPELHPNPHTFLPERFLDTALPPGTLLPWGAGRKRCPGRQLALMEIRTVLRQVLSTRLVLPASTRIERPHWRTALLTPRDGAKVILHTRRSRPDSRFARAHSGSI